MKTLDPIQVATDYRLGLSTRALALKYGVGKTYMAKYLKRSGEALRPRAHDRAQLMPEILRQYEGGASFNAIGQAMDIAAATVKKWLEEESVALRAWRPNLEGQSFGRLVVEGKAEGSGKTRWVCRCDCGGIATPTTYSLLSGNSKSCGCAKVETGVKLRRDATGERYGRLVAIAPVQSVDRSMHWKFQCDCGETCVKRLASVRYGTIKSCGCLLAKEERAARLMVDITGFRHGLLTAVKRIGVTKEWAWACDCGGLKVATKHSVVAGLVKSCGCIARGEDSIQSWLSGSFRNAENAAVVYVFPLACHERYAKIGVATDMEKRKSGSGGQYGEVHDFIELPRLDAWLIEQATLHATKRLANCPTELSDAKWPGYTEVRQMEPAAAFQVALDFHSQLQDLGREEFAIRFLPMTPAEQRALARMAA